METTLLAVVAVALVVNVLYVWGELRDLRDRVITLQLDMAELHANTQEAYSVLVDLAMEDATDGPNVGEWNIVERNGVGR